METTTTAPLPHWLKCDECGGNGWGEENPCGYCNGTGRQKPQWKCVTDEYTTFLGRYVFNPKLKSSTDLYHRSDTEGEHHLTYKWGDEHTDRGITSATQQFYGNAQFVEALRRARILGLVPEDSATQLKAALAEVERLKKVVADLLEGCRWWARQEDGIPEEVATAYVNAMGVLHWAFGTDMDSRALEAATRVDAKKGKETAP